MRKGQGNFFSSFNSIWTFQIQYLKILKLSQNRSKDLTLFIWFKLKISISNFSW